MSIKTVKVCNISLGATDQDIKEFFSFSGDIEYVDLQSHDERSQTAYITFKDSRGAETAVLLSGATIVDLPVTITLDPDYQLPPAVLASKNTSQTSGVAQSVLRKAEDVISGMLAMGFILGKDALTKAKSFDEKHQLTRTTSVKVASFDQKVGLTEKISAGATIVSDKAREVDQRFQVSEKTKSVFAAAEQRVSNAGSAVMTNRYILTGASWVAGAFSKVSQAAGEVAGEVGRKTKEKVEDAEEQQNRKLEAHYAQVLADTPKADSEDIELLSPKPAPAPAPAQGLIL